MIHLKHYNITLINKSPNLDLTQKCQDIKEVFRYINNGGQTKHRFGSLVRYKKLQIRKSNIDVDVEESSKSSKSWHPWVGRILANNYGMRSYCHGKNKHRMFKWN
jgi:hypothetical protein